MGGFFDEEGPGSGNGVDVVRDLDSAALHDTLIACVQRRWLLSIGASRDGFTVSVSLFADGKPQQRKWYDTTEALQEALSDIQSLATAAPGTEPWKAPAKAPKKR